jgi:hypothetical protein
MEVCGDIAWGVLWRTVEFGHTSVGTIHAIVEPR